MLYISIKFNLLDIWNYSKFRSPTCLYEHLFFNCRSYQPTEPTSLSCMWMALLYVWHGKEGLGSPPPARAAGYILGGQSTVTLMSVECLSLSEVFDKTLTKLWQHFDNASTTLGWWESKTIQNTPWGPHSRTWTLRRMFTIFGQHWLVARSSPPWHERPNWLKLRQQRVEHNIQNI